MDVWDDTSDRFAEPTRTFRTSWRGAYDGWLWPTVIGLLIASVVLLLDGAVPEVMLPVFAALVAGGGFVIAARYRLFGVAFVEIAPEAVAAQPFGGPVLRIARGELTEAWCEKKWRLAGGGRRITIREYGFTTDAWIDLSFALHAWQDAGPVETLPGVLARPQQSGASPEVAVYEPQHNPALRWSGPALALMGVVALLMALPGYRDGTWTENLVLTVFAPLFSLGIVMLFLLKLPRFVKRAAFLPDALAIECFVGKPHLLAYPDILDLYHAHLVTRRGRFVLGERNAGAFARLLEPHLEAGQLSGEAFLRSAFELRYLLYGAGAGLVLGFLAAFTLPGGAVAFYAVLFGCLGLAWLAARVMARRELNTTSNS